MTNIKSILTISSISTLLFSCGFYSFTGASISNDIETVSIKYFPNNASTVHPSLSSVITERLKENFITQTNLNIIDQDGDLSFQGEIVEYKINPIGISSNETATQNRLTIKVKVEFINNKEDIRSYNTTFSRYKDFSANEDLSTIEEELIEEITNQLAEDIFNKALVNW